MTTQTSRKVIAGPAGHWYALYSDPQFGENLVGLPMGADGFKNDRNDPPAHPNDLDAPWNAGWYDVTDPAPGVDDAAIIAELKS